MGEACCYCCSNPCPYSKDYRHPDHRHVDYCWHGITINHPQDNIVVGMEVETTEEYNNIFIFRARLHGKIISVSVRNHFHCEHYHGPEPNLYIATLEGGEYVNLSWLQPLHHHCHHDQHPHRHHCHHCHDCHGHCHHCC